MMTDYQHDPELTEVATGKMDKNRTSKGYKIGERSGDSISITKTSSPGGIAPLNESVLYLTKSDLLKMLAMFGEGDWNKLGDKLTKDLFDLGSDPGLKCHRIAFKSPARPGGKELDLGGMAKVCFSAWIKIWMRNNLNTPATEPEKGEG